MLISFNFLISEHFTVLFVWIKVFMIVFGVIEEISKKSQS